jgi:hypothetical protein
MNDLIAELERVRRAVGSETAGDGVAHVVELRRVYGAPVPEVWDVCTNPERIPRWFVPIGGDLRLGGRFSSRATPAARSPSASRRDGSLSHGSSAVTRAS